MQKAFLTLSLLQYTITDWLHMTARTLKIQENEKLRSLHMIELHIIRDMNYYFLMREFTYYTETILGSSENMVLAQWIYGCVNQSSLSLPPCKTLLLSYNLFLILELRNQFSLPIPSFFLDFYYQTDQ